MIPRTLALLSLLALGCFEVRPLDRSFDAGVDAAADAAPVVQPDGGPDCAPLDKTCDGLDDDCDGRYDEDFGEAQACGIGRCRETSTPARCVSGFPIECLPGPSAPEACDGQDNDCDGAVDEDLTRGCGVREGICTRGEERCEGGRWTPCDGVMPADETCDGRDEDCDGDSDEGLTRPCDGAGQCGSGIELCRRGQWQGCDVAGSDEECNGLDDDCDGAVDELPPRACGEDLGACALGEQACTGGAWSACEGAIDPAPIDVCDGLDDDCDGEVDEGEGPCGACGLEGRPVCPIGLDPCPEPPPLVLCITEAGGARGDLGDRLGRRLVARGDSNGDGVDDFVAGGERVVTALSGVDGGQQWRRGNPVDRLGGLVAADVTDDPRPELILGDLDRPGGAVVLLAPGGAQRDLFRGGEDAPIGAVIAALDGLPTIAVGVPDAADGQGVVRLLTVENDNFSPDVLDIALDGSQAFGAELALGRSRAGPPLLAATDGPPESRAVLIVADPFEPDDRRTAVLIEPGPGVGARLALGPLVRGRPPTVVALNAEQPWVDLVDAEAELGGRIAIRLPVDAVADDVAILPAGPDGQPLLVILTGSTLRLIAVGEAGSASVVDYPLPIAALETPEGRGRVAALSSPAGLRRVAVSAPTDGLGRGRIVILAIE